LNNVLAKDSESGSGIPCSTRKKVIKKLNLLTSLHLLFYGLYTFRLNSDPSMHLGDITSVNVTMLGGGIQWNVVPDSLSMGMDLRVTISDDHKVLYNSTCITYNRLLVYIHCNNSFT